MMGKPAPWTGGFTNLTKEHGFEPLRVEGKIPSSLKGTFYRNGPGIYKLFEQPYPHWFDGDGAMTAIRLDSGQVQGAARILATPGLQKEREVGKNLYDGYLAKYSSVWQRLRSFAGKSTTKNTANTSVMMWQNQLMALMEGCLPFLVDPKTLLAQSETTLNGLLSHALSAHPHRVPARKSYFTFAQKYGPTSSLELFMLPDEGNPKSLGTFPLSWPSMVHDFIVTQRYVIFFSPPLKLNGLKFIFGKKGISDCLEWLPELGTEIIIVPIDHPAGIIRIEAEPFFQWHFANAFEKGADLIVDFVRYPDFKSSPALGEILRGPSTHPLDGQFYRGIINITDRKARFEKVHSVYCDFPSVSPEKLCQPADESFLACFSSEKAQHGHLDSFGKLNISTGTLSTVPLSEGHYPGEPLFVDGSILSIIYDSNSHRTYLGIADANHLSDGLIAKAWFDHPIPPGFHGIFVKN